MSGTEPVRVVAGAKFGADVRIRQSKDFSTVLALRQVVRGRSAVLHYAPNGLSTARLGLIVGRKTDKLAVGRNLFKRIAREAFRAVRQDLPTVDVILRATASPRSAGRAQLRLDIDRLLARLAR